SVSREVFLSFKIAPRTRLHPGRNQSVLRWREEDKRDVTRTTYALCSREPWMGCVVQSPNARSDKLARGDFPEFAALSRNMSLREKTFQSIAIDNELATVARNQMLSLEQTQMFGNSGPRGADQFSQVLVPGRQCQAHPFSIADAEVFTQLQQNQSQALLQSA